MDLNQKLSDSFILNELLKTNVRNIPEQTDPPQEIINNLKTLCIKVLQPLRNSLKHPITVNSGYRCPRVNKAIGGAKTSQHLKGQAADIELYLDGKNGNFRLAQEVLRAKIIFDQMILEFGTFENPNWIHISYDPTKVIQRGKILRAETINGKTIYTEIKAETIWH